MFGARGSSAGEAEQGGASEWASEPVLKWNVTCARPVTLVVMPLKPDYSETLR